MDKVCHGIASYFQLKHNFSRASIYGLSIDAIYWLVFGNVMRLVYDYYLYTDAQVQSQYFNRYQKHHQTPYYSTVFAFHQLSVWSIVLFYQIIYLYPHTMHKQVQRNFYVSSSLTSIYIFIGAILYFCSKFRVHNELGYYGIMKLDFINWFWTLDQFIDLTSYTIPIISVNWQLMTTRGVNFYFVILELAAVMIELLAAWFDSSNNQYQLALYCIFYLFKITCLTVILYQCRIYKKRKLRETAATV